jgi:CRP/FNR family transcriptional regulator, cyclic AMP receptor protein
LPPTNPLSQFENVARNPTSGSALSALLRRAGPGTSIRVYRDKEVIYSQDHPADAIFYIQRGIVKLTVGKGPAGRRAVLAILAKGAIFGEGCLLPTRGARRMSTATSIGSSTIVRVKKAVFRARLEREPVLAVLLIRLLISQAALLKTDLADHRLSSTGERRLARVLLVYSRIAPKSKNGPSMRPLSQTTLAELVGTSRTRVNLFMNKFRKQGYVRYNGELEVDEERLAAFLRG